METNNFNLELRKYSIVSGVARKNLLYWLPQKFTIEETLDFYKKVSEIETDFDLLATLELYTGTIRKVSQNRKLFLEICEKCGYAGNVLIRNAQAASFTIEIPFDNVKTEVRRITLEMIYDITDYTDTMFLSDIRQMILDDRIDTSVHRKNTMTLLQIIDTYLPGYLKSLPYLSVVE